MEKDKEKIGNLSSDHWIVKSNALNEIRNNRMTISQIRLFSIYLSKINPKDINSREVTFKLEEYTKIMQFKRTNTTQLMHTADELLGLVVTFWDKDGRYNADGLVGFVKCQIFKRFRLFKNDEGEWLISIDCHDDVLKLMFELQGYYFKYQLWNALQLTGTNQQRMYEILKQYEFAGVREISVKDLREFLGIKPEEYPRWERFKTRVLDTAQEALANYTDIKFTWEVVGKRGRGGKINKIKFNIEKNGNYERKITLDEYLLAQRETLIEDETKAFIRPDNETVATNIDTDKTESIKCSKVLDFIEESLLENELLAILNAAEGDVDLVHRRYDMAKQKNKLDNLVGFLIWAVKQPDEKFKTVSRTKKNKFANFDQRKRDYAEIERLERKYLLDSLKEQGQEKV